MASLFGRGFNPLHLHKKGTTEVVPFLWRWRGLNLFVFYNFCPSIFTKKAQLRLCLFCMELSKKLLHLLFFASHDDDVPLADDNVGVGVGIEVFGWA